MSHTPHLRALPSDGPDEATPPGCLDVAALHRLADERDELDGAARAAMADHLDACAACAARMQQIRRFRTALLRSRVPGLSGEQWRALDERMALLGSETAPRTISLGARAYWGLAVAAGVAALAIGGWRLLEARGAAAAAEAQSVASLQAQAALAAAALQVRGEVAGLEIDAGDGHWQPLREGSPLPQGALLRAGAVQAALVLTAADRRSVAELVLHADSEALVEQANGADVFLRLRRGTVELTVAHRSKDQRFAVLAGGHRVQVVGTRFSVRHGADAAVEVRVFEGAVRVDAAPDATAAAGETLVVVRAGQRWQVRGGQIAFGPIADAEAGAAASAEVPVAHPAPQAGAVGTASAPTPAPASPGHEALTPAAQAWQGAEAGAPASADARRATGAAPGQRLTARREATAADAGQEPPPALPDVDAGARAEPAGKAFLIEVPPQQMSAEEVARARALEVRAGAQKSRPAAPPAQREAPTSNSTR